MRDIAIIGMSGIFPQAEDLNEFALNLQNGRDSVRELPLERRRYSTLDRYKNFRKAGFLDRVDLFDYPFFKISLAEAEKMDPQQRVMLELVVSAIENAGYSLAAFSGSNTAVYMSASKSRYKSLLRSDDTMSVTGTLHESVAGRVSYLLDLRGPSMMIDTTCSSSLVSISEACTNLIAGTIDCAVVGAISIMSFPPERVQASGIDLYSTHEKCMSFDARANGMTSGEGGGVLILKELSRALSDRDNIHAVIKTFGVNHDGSRSAGFTAPSPVAQEELLSKVWKHINVLDLSYIEAHGSATKLGDPIEFKGITGALIKSGMKEQRACAISSVKSNIGHLDVAAGMAGIIKTILSIQNSQHFPSLHFQTPNPLIEVQSPAFVNAMLTQAPSGIALAGVSSFGLTGTNAHMVLAPFKPLPKEDQKEPSEYLFTLSAKNKKVFDEYLRRLKNAIETNEYSLTDLSFTLNNGRSDYSYRNAIVASDKTDLLKSIDRIFREQEGPDTQGKMKQVVALFVAPSGDRMPKVSDASGIYDEKFIECSNHKASDRLSYIYSLFYSLSNAGISFGRYVGIGEGNLVTQIITNKISLGDVANMSDSVSSPVIPDVETLRTFLRDPAESVIFNFAAGNEVAQKIGSAGYTVIDFDPEKDSVLDAIAKLYKTGIDINWELYYRNSRPRRIQLPTYPFEKLRAWYKEPDERHQLADWMYEISWQPADVDGATPDFSRPFVFVCDSPEDVPESFRSLITANGGKYFQISPVSDEEIISKVRDAAGTPHFIFIDRAKALSETASRLSDKFRLCKSILQLMDSDHVRLLFLTICAHNILSGEVPDPEMYSYQGLAKGVEAESKSIIALCIDTNVIDPARILELMFQETWRTLGVRDRITYVPTLIHSENIPTDKDILLRDGGTYLITGGTEGAGFEVANHLANKNNTIRLIIVGRSTLPPREAWTSSTVLENLTARDKSKVEKLKLIQALGCEVIYFSTDLSDVDATRALMDSITKNNWMPNGIIHSAALPGLKWIANDTPDDFMRVFRSRVTAAVIFTLSSEKIKPDFVILFSSLSGIMPVYPRKAAYAASCNFVAALPAFAKAMNIHNVRTIHWSDWKETGMFHRLKPEEHTPVTFLQMTTNEGLSVVDLVLSGTGQNYYCFSHPELFNPSTSTSGLIGNKYFDTSKILTPEEKEVSVTEDRWDGVVKIGNVLAPLSLTVEEQLIVFWKQILKSDTITRDDDFFEVGGQSLNGFLLLNMVEKEFNVKLEIDSLFEHGVLKDFASFLEGLIPEKATNKSLTITKTNSLIFPATYAQGSMWYHCQDHSTRTAYNLPFVFEIHGDINTVAVEKAVRSLVERHESLRTVFSNSGTEVYQHVLHDEASNAIVRSVNLSNQSSIDRMINDEVNYVFDLERGPLFRVTLAKMVSDSFLICINIHHIVCDGWSVNIIWKDLQYFLRMYTEGNQPELAPLSFQYKDFAVWQREQYPAEKSEASSKFWSNYLNAPRARLNLHLDRQRKNFRTFSGNSLIFDLDTSVSNAIKELAKEEKTTLFVALLTVVNSMLFRSTRQDDIIIGTPSAGREIAALADQVGLYANLLPIRTFVNGQKSFRELLVDVSSNFQKVLTHQYYPFDRIVQDIRIQHDPARHPLFDIVVVMQDIVTSQEDSGESFGKLEVSPYEHNLIRIKFDLTVNFSNIGNTVRVGFEYNTDLFDSVSVEVMKQQMETLLSDIIQKPDVHLDELFRPRESGRLVISNDFG
jgi:3-oxoacyl-(acyl-carrier-protein) synthase/NAD(P)-dependent dehydrogenase (short-subunit alcohol dehydrogenase family)